MAHLSKGDFVWTESLEALMLRGVFANRALKYAIFYLHDDVFFLSTMDLICFQVVVEEYQVEFSPMPILLRVHIVGKGLQELSCICLPLGKGQVALGKRRQRAPRRLLQLRMGAS